MSILIKGMEMPKDREIILRIDEKGEVYIYGAYPTKLYSAVELPPHGRLIDADALHIDLMNRGIADIQTSDWYEIQQAVDDASTIIKSEE